MSGKNEHITEQLVEQIAIISYEQVRIRNGELPMPSWTGAGAMTRYRAKQDVLEVLNLVVPVLIEQGWVPPVEADEMKAVVECVSTLLEDITIHHGSGLTENASAATRAPLGEGGNNE
ncbi:hypothetical protein [Glutamicibacter halophytocola]|uniref:hypothetical protein n=1 Tax=Glutamicibacter halophytocola TaxID=1933880 RepID=UPI0015C5400E|nr:hypothetical protein [Glutamicibacter halophytocola]NQD40532.1 hypothetical protein [Glutamicibacter halophytocola]